jgi:hypothetical protein
MLLKSIHGLEPGEVLARPLRRHGRREMLLAAGAVLDVGTLERLARIGIRQAWIEHPGTSVIVEGDVPMFKRLAFAALVVAATILTGSSFA